jgi:hypothetical protein
MPIVGIQTWFVPWYLLHQTAVEVVVVTVVLTVAVLVVTTLGQTDGQLYESATRAAAGPAVVVPAPAAEAPPR